MKCQGWYNPECNRMDAVNFRMRTAYHIESKNFRVLCPDCQKECIEYWDAEWENLNNELMQSLKDNPHA